MNVGARITSSQLRRGPAKVIPWPASLSRALRALSMTYSSAHSKSLRGSGRLRFAPARDIGH